MKNYALICAYNEEKTVASVIRKTLKYVDKIIFVNDGSTDNTLKVVQNNFGRNKNVIIITYPDNMGKGYALTTGFKRFLKENGDILITLDADGQHDPTQIPMVKLMVEKGVCDIVIGSRYAKIKDYPMMRVIFNIISTLIMLITSGTFYSDVASGFRCYSDKAVKKIAQKLTLYNFGIELEILKLSTEENLKVGIVPVTCSYDAGTKPNFSRIARGYISFIFKYWKDIGRRILRIK